MADIIQPGKINTVLSDIDCSLYYSSVRFLLLWWMAGNVNSKSVSMMEQETKKCTRCKKERPMKDFYHEKTDRGPLKLCKDCRKKVRANVAAFKKGLAKPTPDKWCCGKVGLKEFRRRIKNGITCSESCTRYKSKDYPCSRYPAKFEVQYSKVELALTCIDFKQK